MPIPAYIICSRSTAEDVNTRQMSLFHIVDTFKVTRIGAAGSALAQSSMSICVTAAWVLEPTDSKGEKYDYEIFGILPNSNFRMNIASGQFIFEKPIHRVTSNGTVAGFPDVGIMKFISRIRKTESQQWIEYSYPVLVSESPAE